MTTPSSGTPVVISAASGTGKTSLCARMPATVGGLARSVSYTTRDRRPHEVDGRDYHFVDDAVFSRMIDDGAFVEWAEVFGRRYGTAYHSVQEKLQSGVDLLLDIDVQGGEQIRARFPSALLIFLLPPSMAELRRRLEGRATESVSAVEVRLAEARREIGAGAGLRLPRGERRPRSRHPRCGCRDPSSPAPKSTIRGPGRRPPGGPLSPFLSPFCAFAFVP